MNKFNFLNEVIVNTENNINMVILKKIDISKVVDFFLNKFLKNENKIILVSFLNKGEDIIRENMIVLDCNTQEKSKNEKIINIKNPNSLINIQIGLENAIEKIQGNAIIIFDSLNLLSIYNNQRDLGRFIYFLSNKIKLENNSAIYLTNLESIEKNTLDLAKQFCDNIFDYSTISIDSFKKIDF